jgi:UDP-galactopyranose mutase
VHDLVLRGGRAVAVSTDAGEVDADVVVVACDPRRLPALAPLVQRTKPALPPVVTHVGLEGDLPDLAHETVLHGAGTEPTGHRARTRSRVDAPRAVAGSTRTCSRRWPGATSTSARRWSRGSSPLPRPGRRVGRVAVRRAVAGPPDGRSGGSARPHRSRRVRRRRARDARAGLPYVGLSASLVAQLVGPA